MEEEKSKKPGKRTQVDWEQVAIDIRAGLLTDRQIGDKHGRTHGAIQAYARKHGIERNLTGRIQERTEIKLAKALLAKEISQEATAGQLKLTQEQTIEFASEVSSVIVIKQQGRIGRHLKISQALIDELESQTIDRELYERLGEMMENPDENGDKLNQLYRKVISTTSRVDSHKKAVETERLLISMEREAFGLDTKATATGLEAKFMAVIEANT